PPHDDVPLRCILDATDAPGLAFYCGGGVVPQGASVSVRENTKIGRALTFGATSSLSERAVGQYSRNIR
ncbi:MAG: hypothetical protein ACRDTD_30745, partial [Pseudonocardiaceae bacterium]